MLLMRRNEERRQSLLKQSSKNLTQCVKLGVNMASPLKRRTKANRFEKAPRNKLVSVVVLIGDV